MQEHLFLQSYVITIIIQVSNCFQLFKLIQYFFNQFGLNHLYLHVL